MVTFSLVILSNFLTGNFSILLHDKKMKSTIEIKRKYFAGIFKICLRYSNSFWFQVFK